MVMNYRLRNEQYADKVRRCMKCEGAHCLYMRAPVDQWKSEVVLNLFDHMIYFDPHLAAQFNRLDKFFTNM